MVARAGRVSKRERRAARKLQGDLDLIIRIGRAAAIKVGVTVRTQTLRAFRSGESPANVAARARLAMGELGELLEQTTLYSWLKGLDREILESTKETDGPVFAAATSPAYRRAIKTLQEKLRLGPQGLIAAKAMATAEAARVLTVAEVFVETEIVGSIAGITKEGLLLREGTKVLRDKFSALGLTPPKAHLIEGMIRTETQLAYAAGRGSVWKEPEIDEILWGWKYVTAGDDRVRDIHVAFDGVTLPKDDPWWDVNSPPNGHSCRCQKIPLFEGRKAIQPPEEITVDGKRVDPIADPGFRFDPGNLIQGASIAPQPVE